MSENLTDYYLGEWAKVIKDKTLLECRIEAAKARLAGLEEDDPIIVEIETKIGELDKQYGELRAAEANILSRITSAKSTNQGNPISREPKVDTGDLFSGNVVTPQLEHHDNYRLPTFMNNTAKPEKPPKFEKGQNFTRFAKRFREHVMLCNLQGTRLDLYMLSFIKCEQTWEKLQGLNLADSEGVNINLLIKRYTDELFPPLEATATRAELLTVKQNPGETVEQFCFRISDLASKAGYESSQSMEDSCLNSLITGATDPRVRERILENNIRDYRAAVKIATQTERIRAIQPAPTTHEADNSLYSIVGDKRAEVQNNGQDTHLISTESACLNSNSSSDNTNPVNNLTGRPYFNKMTETSYSNFGRNSNQNHTRQSDQIDHNMPNSGSNFTNDRRSFPNGGHNFSNGGRNFQNNRGNYTNNGRNFPDSGRKFQNNGHNMSQSNGQFNNRPNNGYNVTVNCWNCGGNHFRRNCPQINQYRGNAGYNRYPLNGGWMTGQ